jgi:DNA-binding response OmpR family regulator
MKKKPTILIVDDDPEFCTTANLILSARFDCLIEHSAESALERSLDEIDLVLLDIELGHGMDGLQTLEAIRDRETRLPVIMISQREDARTVARAFRLGANDYIGKKINLDDLSLTVERYLCEEYR